MLGAGWHSFRRVPRLRKAVRAANLRSATFHGGWPVRERRSAGSNSEPRRRNERQLRRSPKPLGAGFGARGLSTSCVEVSGVDAGPESTVNRRLKDKLAQAAAGSSNLPAMAGVVGFKAKLIMLADLLAAGLDN